MGQNIIKAYFDLSAWLTLSSKNRNKGRNKAGKPFPKRQILEPSKLKEFADDKFRFDGKGKRFSKRIENNVGKAEIARYEQFLVFPQCFQKTNAADA